MYETHSIYQALQGYKYYSKFSKLLLCCFMFGLKYMFSFMIVFISIRIQTYMLICYITECNMLYGDLTQTHSHTHTNTLRASADQSINLTPSQSINHSLARSFIASFAQGFLIFDRKPPTTHQPPPHPSPSTTLHVLGRHSTERKKA